MIEAAMLSVTREELLFLMNDLIAYMRRLEDNGRAIPESGYDNRKALLEKLKRFDDEHFPQNTTAG